LRPILRQASLHYRGIPVTHHKLFSSYFSVIVILFIWTSTVGFDGYGFRDNAGTMEVKNSGGAWAAFSTTSLVANFTSGTITGLTALAIRDTSAAFDVTLAAASSTALTAGRTLTLDLVNAARTLKLTGNATLNQDVSTAGSPSFSQMTSTVATGTAPLVVASTTAVTNLNASLLLGQTWADTGASGIGGGTPRPGAFTALSLTGNIEITKQTPRIDFTGTGLSTKSYGFGTDYTGFGDFGIRNTTDGVTEFVILGSGGVTMPGGGGLAVTGDVSLTGALKLGNTAAAGTITPDKTLLLKDNTGTLYKVAVVAA